MEREFGTNSAFIDSSTLEEEFENMARLRRQMDLTATSRTVGVVFLSAAAIVGGFGLQAMQETGAYPVVFTAAVLACAALAALCLFLSGRVSAIIGHEIRTRRVSRSINQNIAYMDRAFELGPDEGLPSGRKTGSDGAGGAMGAA